LADASISISFQQSKWVNVSSKSLYYSIGTYASSDGEFSNNPFYDGKPAVGGGGGGGGGGGYLTGGSPFGSGSGSPGGAARVSYVYKWST